MRLFKLMNVVKMTDNAVKIAQYQRKGYKEVKPEQKAVEPDVEPENLGENLELKTVKELKEMADDQHLDYDAKIKKNDLIDLLGR